MAVALSWGGRKTMRVILCTLNGRIAPKYYDAAQLLLLHIRDGVVAHREVIAVEALEPDELCSLVLHMKTDVVICGGIRQDYQEKLAGSSVQLIYNVIGNTEEVVERFVEGTLRTGDIVSQQ
jgi:predicted Fe-Mo cluster-binding NifX family protein